MKKIIMLIAAIMLVASMTITAYAVTPTLNIHDMPEISNIKITVNLDKNLENAVENHVNNWFKDHPIDFSKFKFKGFGD